MGGEWGGIFSKSQKDFSPRIIDESPSKFNLKEMKNKFFKEKIKKTSEEFR